MPLIPSDSPTLSLLFDGNPPISLAVTYAFTSIYNISDANKRRNSLNVQETAMTSEKILKKTLRNGGSSRQALPSSDILQNKTQSISVTYIGVLC